jgi:ankyrin repeat protein
MSRREKKRQRSREERQQREKYKKPKAEIDNFEGLSAAERELFVAAAQGDTTTIVDLIQKVDPNIKDSNGTTPLFYAKNLRTVKLLVESGATVNAQNNEGITRLHMDVVFGRIRFVKYLLEHEADVKLASNTGVTPLHLATMISYFEHPEKAAVALVAGEIVRQVVTLAAATVVAAAGGTLEAALLPVTAATLAALVSVDIVVRNRLLELLLQKGANPNAQDADGNTPLHTLAAGRLLEPTNRHGGVIMAEHLILRGARRDIKNDKGQTPYDVAREYSRLVLMPLLNPIRAREQVGRALRTTKEAARKGTKRLGRSMETSGKWLQEKMRDTDNQ